MSNELKKSILSAVVGAFIASFCFIVYIRVNKPEPAPYDSELIQARVDILQQENNNLKVDIAKEREKSVNFLKQIDYLESLPPKIEIRYETKYKTIDAASVGTVVSEFDSVFTNHNLK